MDQAPQHSTQEQPTGARSIFFDFKYYWIAFGVVLLDQLVKLVVKFNMQLWEDIPVLGDTFRINFIENKGAAFGLTIADLFSRIGIPMEEETAKVLLTVFSIVAVVVIAYLLQQVRKHPSRLPFYLAFILGGAIGNIIDRVFYGVWFAGMNWYEGGLFHGQVVDMFYFDLFQGEVWGMELNLFPVFNIADLAITIGIIAIIIFQRRFFQRPPEKSPSPEEKGQ